MEKVLSQEEIDALLRGMSDGKVDTTPGEIDESGIVSYDLANQDRIIHERMPTLEVINDNFSRLFRGSLSISLRKMIEVGSKGVQMVKFGEFIRNLPVPSSLHVFKMEPLRGHAVLALESKLVFNLVEIFLGGSGKRSFKIEGREFTVIESRLIQKVINIIFNDLERAWNIIHPVSVRYIRSEMNPQFVSIVPATDLILMIPFEIEFDQFTGLITLCIPYAMIEPIKNKLHSGYQRDHLEADHSWVERILDRIKWAEVEVVVELGRQTIMVQELLQLTEGDVLPLKNDVANLMIAKVQGVPKFLGKAGVLGENKAFQIEEPIKNNA
jgi:flagellar motor switch protein FliM